MTGRRVLLIGWRPAAVRALEHHGARVTCVLTVREADGRDGLLDDEHVVPVADPACVEDVVAGLARRGLSVDDFDVVASQHEFTLTVAAVLDRLRGGHAGMPMTTAVALRDKETQKQRVRDAGVPVADSCLVHSPDELAGLPWSRGVVKPPALSGTRGVRAWGDAAERRAVAEELGADGSPPPWVAESWVDGHELHVDGVVRDGRVRFASVGRYLHNVLAVRDGDIVASIVQHPAAVPELYTAAGRIAERSMAALGHGDGVFHLEVFETADGLVFGECGGRIGGGSWDRMIELQYGVDLNDQWARAVLGADPELDPRVDDEWVGDVFLRTRSGVIESLPDASRVAARAGVRDVLYSAAPGDTLSSVTEASSTTAGAAVVSGPDEAVTRSRIEDLARWFRDEARVRALPEAG